MPAKASGAKPSAYMILLLGALSAFGPMSIDTYLPAMPTIAESFGAGEGVVELTLAAFLIGLAAGQLFYGPLSDRIGRRGPILSGILLYVAASVACALSSSVEMMIAFRFVQGLGSCSALVVSRAVVRDLYDHQDTARVFSMIILVMGIAPILAPLLGGYLLLAGGWRGIFIVLAAFGAIIFLWVFLGLGESRPDAVARAARGESPLRALAMLTRNRRLLGYMLGGALNSACLFTYIGTSPQLLMNDYGVSATSFGWLFGLNAFGLIATSQVNRVLLGRFDADRILRVASLWSMLAGLVFLAIAITGAGGLVGVMVGLFLVLSSYGLIMGNANAGALSIDPMRAGSISALLGASGFAVGALTMSVASSFAGAGALPIALVMAVALTGAAASFFFLALRPAAVR